MNKTVPLEVGLKWAFTDKPVTPWGGLRLVQEMLLRMRLREALGASGLPWPGSNRGYDPVVMLESFLVCVWVGGNRFAHTALVRFDKALCQMFGWEQVAEVSTFTRFFRRFKREEVDGVFGYLGCWFWEQLSPRMLTLDLDSSVITRFGEQEGTAIGYNRQRWRCWVIAIKWGWCERTRGFTTENSWICLRAKAFPTSSSVERRVR